MKKSGGQTEAFLATSVGAIRVFQRQLPLSYDAGEFREFRLVRARDGKRFWRYDAGRQNERITVCPGYYIYGDWELEGEWWDSTETAVNTKKFIEWSLDNVPIQLISLRVKH